MCGYLVQFGHVIKLDFRLHGKDATRENKLIKIMGYFIFCGFPPARKRR
jgi:hypothetical protein